MFKGIQLSNGLLPQRGRQQQSPVSDDFKLLKNGCYGASKWNTILNHLLRFCNDDAIKSNFLIKHNEFIKKPAADWHRTPDELVIVIISTLNIKGVKSINLGKLCSRVQKKLTNNLAKLCLKNMTAALDRRQGFIDSVQVTSEQKTRSADIRPSVQVISEQKTISVDIRPSVQFEIVYLKPHFHKAKNLESKLLVQPFSDLVRNGSLQRRDIVHARSGVMAKSVASYNDKNLILNYPYNGTSTSDKVKSIAERIVDDYFQDNEQNKAIAQRLITYHIDDIHLHRLGNLLDNNHFVCTGPLSPVGIAVFAIHAVDGENSEDKLMPWIRQELAKMGDNFKRYRLDPFGLEGEAMASIVQTFKQDGPIGLLRDLVLTNGPQIHSATGLLSVASPRSSATSDSTLVDEGSALSATSDSTLVDEGSALSATELTLVDQRSLVVNAFINSQPVSEHVLDYFKTGLPEDFNIDEYGDGICTQFLELAQRYNSAPQSTRRIELKFNNPAPAPVEDNVLEYRNLPQLPFEDSVSRGDRAMIETLYVTFVQDGFIIFN